MTTLTDYSATIRAEIEREVRALKRALNAEMGGWNYFRPHVSLGYLVNTHHGRPLYQEGDHIAGLRVSIDRMLGRTIRVMVDQNIYEQATW